MEEKESIEDRFFDGLVTGGEEAVVASGPDNVSMR